MSWHLEVCGSKEDVTAAIDEAMSIPGGMPPVVGSYLKDAVAACVTSDEYVVSVRSDGHRPLTSSGSSEESVVRVIRAKPWNAIMG